MRVISIELQKFIDMKNIFLTILFAITSTVCLSQLKTGAISGVAINGDSGEPLIGVTIIIDGTDKGVITDINGAFILSEIAPGNYNITFSFIGFNSFIKSNVNVGSEMIEIGDIEMVQSSIALREIVVTPGQFSIMGNSPLSKQTLKSEDIKNMSFAEDITRAVTRLPGVASNDFSSKFTVRGGEDDEVLITLDGMELYEPFHQRDFAGGLFSIVDIETIQSIDLITGGFSSQYGNRESGVFNMQTKQPKTGEKHTSVGLSSMNARVYTDGSFGEKGSYMFSARRGMLDVPVIPTLVQVDAEATPSFYDTFGKIEYKIRNNHSLSFHILHAGDKTDISEDEPGEAVVDNNTKYFNTYSWLTWKASLNPNLFVRTLLYTGFVSHTRNGSTFKDEFSDKLNFNLIDKRTYDSFGVKQDWDFDISDNFILKTGFDIRQLYGTYNYNSTLSDVRINSTDSLVSFNREVDISTNPSGQQTSAYITGKFKLVPNLFMETGIRHDYASYTGDNLISPRVGITYSFSRNTFFRAAWGYYYQTQFMNDLDVSHNSTEFNPAELSKHYVAGFEHHFNNGFNLRVEGYYKDISRLTANYQNLRDPWEVYPESRNDQIRLNYNGASSKGIEFFLKYDQGKKVSWWLSYALAEAVETIVSIEFEGSLIERTGTLPRINNQRHTIYSDINYRPNEKWTFNLSGQYYVGLPQTIYDYDFKNINGINGSNLPLHFYPNHLEFRGLEYPAYHRMDLRTNRHFKVKNGRITAFMHLVNIYNRENQRKFDLDVRDDDDNLIPDGQGGYLYPRDDTTWFGFLPAFGASWEF